MPSFSLPEMIQDLQAADQGGDTQLAQHIAGLIKQAQNPSLGDEIQHSLSTLGPFGMDSAMTNAAAHQIPAVGDAAMTAGQWAGHMLAGQPVSWDQANAEVHQTLHQQQQAEPVQSTVGSVLGAVGSAEAGGAALRGAGLFRATPAAARATSIASHLADAGRVVARGGLAAAAQGGAQQGGEQVAAGHFAQAPQAAAQGAATGFATGVVASPVALAAPAIARVTAPLATKSALALSRVFGEDPGDLQAAWQTFRQNTGRAPTMTELASMKTAGQIKGAARDSSTIADALTQAQEDAARARSDTMSQAFTPPQPVNGGQQVVVGGGPSPAGASSEEIANTTTRQGDVDYVAARQHSFQIPTEESDELGGVSPADHLSAEVLPLAGLGKADRVRIMSGLQGGALSGQDAQLLRSGLSDSLDRNYSPAVAGAIKDLDSFLAGPGNDQANAAFSAARANYAANSQRAAGAAHGESILGSATAPNFAAVAASKPNDNLNFSTGMTSGAAGKLADAASTPAGATNLAQRLATDGSLYQKLSTVFGGRAADAFQRLGQSETAAAKNLAPYAGQVNVADDQDLKDVKTALSAAAAVHSPIGGLVYKATHLAKMGLGLGMSPAVQEKVAGYLSDPKMVGQGINLLRKAGATTAQLRQLSFDVAQRVGAGATGAVNSATQQEAGQ